MREVLVERLKGLMFEGELIGLGGQEGFLSVLEATCLWLVEGRSLVETEGFLKCNRHPALAVQ